MVNMMSKIKPNKDISTQWQTQPEIFMIDKKVKVDFYLPQFSAIKSVTWECHVDETTKGRYYIILSRDLLMDLVLDLKLSKHTITGVD